MMAIGSNFVGWQEMRRKVNNMGYEAAAGIASGLAAGSVFGLAYFAAASLLLLVSPDLLLLVIGGAAGGSLAGLCASVICSKVADKLPSRSMIGRSMMITVPIALPWGLFWFFAMPMTIAAGSSTYTLFIHKFGLETPWLYVPVVSQRINDLEQSGALLVYVATYVVVVLLWASLLGLVLGHLRGRRFRRS